MTTLLSVEHSLSLVMAAQNAEVEDSSTMASSCSLAQDVATLLKKVVLPDNAGPSGAGVPCAITLTKVAGSQWIL